MSFFLKKDDSHGAKDPYSGTALITHELEIKQLDKAVTKDVAQSHADASATDDAADDGTVAAAEATTQHDKNVAPKVHTHSLYVISYNIG